MTADTDDHEIVIGRNFAAPPEVIWEWWTRTGALRRVIRPRGAVIPVARMDVRVGGARLLCMEVTTPDDPIQMWFTGEYLEVIENRRLVYTDAMPDHDGRVLSPDELGIRRSKTARARRDAARAAVASTGPRCQRRGPAGQRASSSSGAAAGLCCRITRSA